MKERIVMTFQPVLGGKASPWSGIVLKSSGGWLSYRKRVKPKECSIQWIQYNREATDDNKESSWKRRVVLVVRRRIHG